MPGTESNATESRLSAFVQGCSQLQEIYAVSPLTYTNIMGEWWQRINDIIYTLGLTQTEETVVNIAWTIPEPGRKRSPFFEEELTTRKPNGEEVSEESRISTVGGDGTGKIKAHKYGLIQSIDFLFQRNIDTWGGLYDYFFNQQHEDGSKPLDLTEMLFGDQGISTEAGGPITSLYDDATRNLYGENKGLVNSMKHIIERIIGSNFFDWLDDDEKECVVGSVIKRCQMWEKTDSGWTKSANDTSYFYRGKHKAEYVFATLVQDDMEWAYPLELSGTVVTSLKNGSTIPLSTFLGNSAYSTLENLFKDTFIKTCCDGENALLVKNISLPNEYDIAYASVKLKANSGNDYYIECTKYGFFEYVDDSWRLIESTYNKAIDGLYSSAAYSSGTDVENGSVCLVETKEEIIDEDDHSPSSISELLFGADANHCDWWKTVGTGSLIQETQKIKDTIGEGLFEVLNGDPLAVCTEGDTTTKPGPHNLQELLFGSMSIEEVCKGFKNLIGQSIFGEITNITEYLGDTYYSYTIKNNPETPDPIPVEPVDPETNPMNVMQNMDPGHLIFGSKSIRRDGTEERAWKEDYIVRMGYICESTYDTELTLAELQRLNKQAVIYNLQTNVKWYVNEDTGQYESVNINCVDEIYNDIGPGRLVSNDITGKFWFIHGDSRFVEHIATTASKLGLSTIGGPFKPIWLDKGVATASDGTTGGVARPIYIDGGTLKVCTGNVGTKTNPVYMSNGTITASDSTIGGTKRPVYLNEGTITAISDTVGGTKKPVYVNGGTLTAISDTVGSGTKPVYLSSGTITASGSNVGNATTPVYMSGGTLTACNSYSTISAGSLHKIKNGSCDKGQTVSFSVKQYSMFATRSTKCSSASVDSGGVLIRSCSHDNAGVRWVIFFSTASSATVTFHYNSETDDGGYMGNGGRDFSWEIYTL